MEINPSVNTNRHLLGLLLEKIIIVVGVFALVGKIIDVFG